MAKANGGKRRLGLAIVAAACLAVAVAASWPLFGARPYSLAGAAQSAETTAAIGQAGNQTGPSGLPLPRFVSLKAEKVNVRRGPSSDHAVAWVFQRKGMPVEIVAEFENWRRIRDSDGDEGWILQNMLSGKRTAAVAPWRKGQAMALYQSAGGGGMVAKLQAGVIGEIEACTGEWCLISAGGYDGWIEQTMLWGVYPGEGVD
ncbi:MAG: SH3 domain-containing protein [Hyphomicrobiales bacterium]